MLNKEKILWCIWAGVLILLFLISSTDLVTEEKKIEIYPISVIIEGDSDGYYTNFRKGMDQAVVEFHGDVGFITPYADHGQAQQMELIKRKIRNGARAVILASVKPEETVKKLEDMNPGCLVIFLSQSPGEGTALDTIGVNGREIERLLGEAAASQASRNAPVYLFRGGLDYGDSAWVYEGVRTVLGEQGYHYRLIEGKNQDTYHRAVQETDAPRGGRITIVALDVQSLDQTTWMLEENAIYQGGVAGLCDAGSTISLLRALDRGAVTGLAAYDQLDEGYLSMKQAVEAIQGTRQKQNTVLKTTYVNKDKLRDRVYEKVLCPIE